MPCGFVTGLLLVCVVRAQEIYDSGAGDDDMLLLQKSLEVDEQASVPGLHTESLQLVLGIAQEHSPFSANGSSPPEGGNQTEEELDPEEASSSEAQAAFDTVIPEKPVGKPADVCDVQSMLLALNGTESAGKPGPMTLVFGRGETADAVLGAPCADPTFVYDPSNHDSMWSATKLITGIVIGAMVDDGLITFDDKLNGIFDYWTTNESDPRSRVTIKHALSQTSGFGDHGCGHIPFLTYADCAEMVYNDAWAKYAEGGTYTNEEYGLVVPAFFTAAMLGADPASFPTTSEPGKYFFYSGGQWQFLGALIEKKTNLSYKDAIKKYISTPLGIASPALEPLNPHSDPGGGIFGTAEAFGKVLGAYLSGSLLEKSTTDIMETPWTHTWSSINIGYKESSVHSSEALGSAKSESHYVGYALGMWVDCDTSDCSNPAVYHSIGGRGFLPVFDRKNNYWAVLARASPPLAADFSNMPDIWSYGATFSVTFFAMLAPTIDQLYDGAEGDFDTSLCDAECQ
jgi:CubicO group peptidase (beta-lactamase class C family)